LIKPSGRFSTDFMEFPATSLQLKFQKYRIFGYFRVNLGTFFSFKMMIFAKNRPENTENGFLEFF
jgi:hypothetical protein